MRSEPDNAEAIRESFGKQAADFEGKSMSFSKKEYLEYTVRSMGPSETDSVLEVAAGTCACGRAIAPYASTVTCLDLTAAMLEVGRREAESEGLHNMVFVLGNAEELPFLDGSFDIVVTRLALHHFPDVSRPMDEMVRVLRPGGRLVIIDMEATEEELRERRDEIETLRDPSHVRVLSTKEIRELLEARSVEVCTSEVTPIPVSLDSWMDLTKVGPETRETIVSAMRRDIDGGDPTGFHPYEKESSIYFDQRWSLVIGTKV